MPRRTDEEVKAAIAVLDNADLTDLVNCYAAMILKQALQWSLGDPSGGPMERLINNLSADGKVTVQ